MKTMDGAYGTIRSFLHLENLDWRGRGDFFGRWIASITSGEKEHALLQNVNIGHILVRYSSYMCEHVLQK